MGKILHLLHLWGGIARKCTVVYVAMCTLSIYVAGLEIIWETCQQCRSLNSANQREEWYVEWGYHGCTFYILYTILLVARIKVEHFF